MFIPSRNKVKPYAVAVVGANYGDEGKGATTHFLTKTLQAKTVVRHNGGPQAGHTVQLRSGLRHVFSSFGSGTFAGAKTHVSNTALFNPKEAYFEKGTLQDKRVSVGNIRLGRETQMITPWDIAINQFLEKGRGADAHGSTGMGIGETVHRFKEKKVCVYSSDLLDEFSTRFNRLCDTLHDHFYLRMSEQCATGVFEGLDRSKYETLCRLVENPTPLVTAFKKYATALREVAITQLDESRAGSGAVIYEGAQGLLLDEDDLDHFPHVTRSKTGITNALKDCKDSGLELKEVYFCTRPYLTRHGNGPIKAGFPNSKLSFSDPTNKPNDYQGSLRFADLDFSSLEARILAHLAEHPQTKAHAKIALSCLDQVQGPNLFKFVYGGVAEMIRPETLPRKIEEKLGIEVVVIDGLNG